MPKYEDVDIAAAVAESQQSSTSAAEESGATSTPVETSPAQPAEDLVGRATELKQTGNTHFRAKRLPEALACYDRAIALLDGEEAEGCAPLLATCLVNAAVVHLRQEAPALCVAACVRAKAIDPLLPKAAIRHARGLKLLPEGKVSLEQLQEAAKDVEAVLAHIDGPGTAPASVKKALVTELAELRTLITARSPAPTAAAGSKAEEAKEENPRRKPALTMEKMPVYFTDEDWSYMASRDGVDQNLLISCHTLGDTPDKFITFGVTAKIPQTALLSVAGPHPLPLGLPGRAWYHEFTPVGEETTDQDKRDSLELGIKRLEACIDAAIAVGWTPQAMHLFGLGQGATVALHYALRAKVGVGSVVAVGAGLLGEAQVATTALPRTTTVTLVCPMAESDWVPETTKVLSEHFQTKVVRVSSQPPLRLSTNSEVGAVIKHVSNTFAMRMVNLEDSADVVELK